MGTWLDIVPENRTWAGVEVVVDSGTNTREDVDEPPMSVSDISAHASTLEGLAKSQSARSCLGPSRASSLITGEGC